MSNDRILCPFHDESTPSCVLYEARYHCFGCGKNGPLKEIGKEKKDAPKSTYKENIQESIQRIKSLDMALVRGLYLPCDDISYYIVWPYDNYYKRRFKNDGKSKYINPTGVPKPLYWASQYNVNGDKKTSYMLFIVEGELNALSLSRAGFKDVCSPGSANELYAKAYIPYFIRYENILIIADEDIPGAIGAIKLKKELIALNHTNVRIGLMSKDCNEVLQEKGTDGLKREIVEMFQGL